MSEPTTLRPTSEPGQQRRSPLATQYAKVLLCLILLLAAFLRFYQLGASSLWSDEGNTWALLGRSFRQIAYAAAADIHPPGYYWLLKIWTSGVGANATGMRSLSAVAGVALVFVVYKIGRTVATDETSAPSTALLAALIAALNPLQIYYSQEARMYMLLALESAGLFWALLALLAAQKGKPQGAQINADPATAYGPACGYILCGVAGLWTHYSFPIVLAAAGLAYLWDWVSNAEWRKAARHSSLVTHPLLRFVLLNLLVVLAFAPWAPIALDRILHWPKGGAQVAAVESLRLTLQTLLFGPLRHLPAPVGPWLWLAGGLPLLGLIALRRQSNVSAIALWLLAPLFLMFGLGLFSDAFLKFLLIAAPAWCVAVAATPRLLRTDLLSRFTRHAVHLLFLLVVLLGAISVAVRTLPGYYADPAARDNYAGVARYVQALGNPATDLMLLDAPGQQEVWRYYDPGLPVLALPQQRPPDPQQTVAALTAAVKKRDQIFALFWATDEADPAHLVEQWLDQHAFKGLESWQGNVRFVTYRMPNALTCAPLAPATTFGQQIALVEQCQPTFPQAIAAGEVALVGLHWQALTKIDQRYKVSVQLLNAANQVVAQHDSEPAGGSQPTDRWLLRTIVNDQHGLNIPFGTPPGAYQLIAALYDQENGQRLAVGATDHVVLGEVHVTRPQRALPVAILPIQHRLNAQLGGMKLLGYDAYRKGYAHAPETPVQPGDLVHFTFYWQAPDLLPTQGLPKANFRLELGPETLNAALVPGYPVQAWRAGDVLRGEFDLPFTGSDRTPQLWFAEIKVTLESLPR